MIAGSSIFLGRFFLNPCCVRSTVLFDEQYWFFECAFFCCGPSVSIILSGFGVCCLCVCVFWKGSFNSLIVAFFLLAFCFFSCDRLLVIEVAPALIACSLCVGFLFFYCDHSARYCQITIVSFFARRLLFGSVVEVWSIVPLLAVPLAISVFRDSESL